MNEYINYAIAELISASRPAKVVSAISNLNQLNQSGYQWKPLCFFTNRNNCFAK
jgi:hypothetical protein